MRKILVLLLLSGCSTMETRPLSDQQIMGLYMLGQQLQQQSRPAYVVQPTTCVTNPLGSFVHTHCY